LAWLELPLLSVLEKNKTEMVAIIGLLELLVLLLVSGGWCRGHYWFGMKKKKLGEVIV